MTQMSLMSLGKKRPTDSDLRIKPLVIAAILPNVMEWLSQDAYLHKEQEIKEDLEAAIMNSWEDGYELAKKLDCYHSWAADSNLVEILNSVPVIWHDKHMKLIKEWVTEEGVKPPFEDGSAVYVPTSSTKKEWVHGTILAHHPDAARSTVYCPSLGHVKKGVGTHGLLINWEDMKPMVEAEEKL